MLVSPQEVSVEDISTNMEELFTPVAQQKGIHFNLSLEGKMPEKFVSDRTKIEQILKNFLSNSFKFTEQGKVELVIQEEKGGLAFKVRDSGIGIAPEQQNVIFEAFHQADGTTNRKYGGTGLGLSISRELARLLGGEIQIESALGKGSTFTLLVPLEFVGEKKFQTTQKKDKLLPIKTALPLIEFSFKDDRDKIDSKSRIILIVEDDESFAKILFGLAHDSGFKAIVSPSAQEGLDLAREFSPHAILLDIRLPAHSGLIVLDQLKLDPTTRHIPVHVISGHDLSRNVREMGAQGHMLRPAKKEDLKTTFANLISFMASKHKKVLVVEDDEAQKEHIVGLLSGPTAQVDAVSTAKGALDFLSKNTYDCMVMGLSLPDMSGLELLAKMSKEATNSYPPVIVYTARDISQEEEDQLRLYSESIVIKGAKSPERLLNEVTLFLHRVESDLPPERQKMLRDLRNRDKTLEHKKVLIVDDDVRNIFALTSALEQHGALPVVARNGREALQRLDEESEIGLVLMDIMMPEMDGLEAMRRIRAEKKYKDLPIIALTAKAMKDDQEKCLASGANDYMAKPLEMDKLVSLMRIWLRNKRSMIN